MIPETPQRLRKVAPVRIFEQAVEQIRDLILIGQLQPGQKLPTEQELGKQLDVSRSSVREALRVLEAEGLVEVRRGQGTFVALRPPASPAPSQAARWLGQREEALEQMLQVREYIEALAASLTARRATDAQLDNLRRLVQEQSQLMQAAGAENYDSLLQLDAAFHLAIAAASGNDIANEIINHIVPSFNESNRAVLYVSRRMQRMVDEHRTILTALEARDPAASEAAMRAHLARVREAILGLVETRPVNR